MEHKESKNTMDKLTKFTPALLIVVLFISIFNFYQIQPFSKESQEGKVAIPQAASQTIQVQSAIIPKGVPKIYGDELGVSFDDISSTNAQKADSTIKKIGMLDNKITLQGADLQRYIKIVSQISCEYCCGADTIITPDGKPSCGCAHSYAMRGLAKYLIQNHPNEFTDDEILTELAKLKTLFFPGQMSKKASVLQSKGIEVSYINLGSNKYRGIETSASGSGSGMVGGC